MKNEEAPIVRIQKIQISNFKNVKNGSIEFKNNILENDISDKSEILGIYGQNGSGKTALVDASNFLKMLFCGIPLPKDLINYINLTSDGCEIKIDLYIKKNENLYLSSYVVNFTKTNDTAIITYEKLSYSKYQDDVWTPKVNLIEYDPASVEIIKPKYRYSNILDSETSIVNFKVTEKICVQERKSLIFNEEIQRIINNAIENDTDFKNIIESIIYFARCNLFVIPNNHNAIISMNILMPLSFRLEEEKSITSGDVGIALDNISLIPTKEFKLVKSIIEQMNIVLSAIVPNLNINLYDYGDELAPNGELKKRVELVSIKSNKNLPIRYESEGIKKIISILSALIAMYNNMSICMIVDELDSGIYEFLLGEVLKVIDNGGKGQLIFTSHNLRPLEILRKESVYFTTTNPLKNYVHFNYVKPSNNLRSLYLRSINLGGQKESLYNETDELEMRRAFRMAGDIKKYGV